MKANLQTSIKSWFDENQEYCLEYYSSCSEWLNDYVECGFMFVEDFFDYDEYKNLDDKQLEPLRQVALNWIAENADDIVNFYDYRD